KRTAIDVIADELGPSLRWATAQVERTPRQDGNAPKKTGGGANPGGDESPFTGEEPF
ncbi:MAG: single-stranded DNA-binding protein, partial [Acidimicrobiia bacterium]|nr:single-stranded DNA-binding protein [Acidimicrobiia bacterium]